MVLTLSRQFVTLTGTGKAVRVFYFVEESPGRGTEDINKECNINFSDFFFLLCVFDGRHIWKNHSQKNCTNIEKGRNACTPEKN